jgi:hypothetical protein
VGALARARCAGRAGAPALRPWIDRRLFAERPALARRFDELLRELSASTNVEQLVRLSGEGIDRLLRPDAIATYARIGEQFVPLFVRGRGVPPAFEAESHLVHVLSGRSEPLLSRAKGLGAFDCAALETLGAEVVVPTRRGDALVAFTCLGVKRSGDIYTGSDLALLSAVARQCAEVLARLAPSSGASAPPTA